MPANGHTHPSVCTKTTRRYVFNGKPPTKDNVSGSWSANPFMFDIDVC